MEGQSAAAGTAIDWAKEIGLYGDYKDLETHAMEVPNSGGVIFVPHILGLLRAYLNFSNLIYI